MDNGRRKEIIKLIHLYGELSVQELSELLGISPSSIRRDLISLGHSRFVTRTRGGAAIATMIDYKTYPSYVLPDNPCHVRAIAHRAAQMIEPGDVIGLSGGELCTHLALLIRLMEDITVVTNAVNIAVELSSFPGIQVRLAGGHLNLGSYELVGQGVEASLQGVHIQKFFLGTDGLSIENGVTGHDEPEAMAARTIMAHADSTIVLACASRFRQTSFARVAPLSDFTAVITTRDVPQAVLDEFEAAGMGTLVATRPYEATELSMEGTRQSMDV